MQVTIKKSFLTTCASKMLLIFPKKISFSGRKNRFLADFAAGDF